MLTCEQCYADERNSSSLSTDKEDSKASPYIQPDTEGWEELARKYGSQAGVDSKLLLAFALIESSGKESIYGRFATQVENQMGVFLANVIGWYPPSPEGSSLGVTNIKPATFNEVAKAYPSQFKSVKWANLVGNGDLDIKTTAYYIRYLTEKYASRAPSSLTSKYSSEQIIEGL